MIRVAGHPDIRHMARIHAASFERPWSVAEIQKLMEQPGVKGFVYDAAGSWAAFGLLRMVEDEAEILTIATDPAYRGKGIATQLLHFIIHYAERESIARLFLEVAEDNLAAHTLYDQNGFAPFATRKGYYTRWHGRAVDAICMEKTLGKT